MRKRTQKQKRISLATVSFDLANPFGPFHESERGVWTFCCFAASIVIVTFRFTFCTKRSRWPSFTSVSKNRSADHGKRSPQAMASVDLSRPPNLVEKRMNFPSLGEDHKKIAKLGNSDAFVPQ